MDGLFQNTVFNQKAKLKCIKCLIDSRSNLKITK